MSSDQTTAGEAQATYTDLGSSVARLTYLSDGFGKSMTTALRQAIVQGKQLDQVLKGLSLNLINASLSSALRPVFDSLGSAVESGLGAAMNGVFGGLMGFRDGGVFDRGRVQPFASGGVVSQPTYFPMSGGTGLMGEAGPEAIMPLTRGPDGRLGVATAGGGAPLHVTFNVSTPDVEGFARSEAQMTSLLARAVGRGRRGL